MRLNNVGRVLIGILYLFSSLFNLIATLRNPDPLWNFFRETVNITLFETILNNWIIPNSTIVILLVVVFEVITGLLILSSGVLVKVGLIIGILWSISLIPYLAQPPFFYVNAVLAIIQALLLKGRYKDTLYEMLRNLL